jgi:hypothetical protein
MYSTCNVDVGDSWYAHIAASQHMIDKKHWFKTMKTLLDMVCVANSKVWDARIDENDTLSLAKGKW